MELRPGYKQTDIGVIPNDWDVRKIRAVSTLINGRGFKPFEWKTSGLPIIRIQNLNGSEEFNFYQGPYDKKLEVEAGQLLFAWSGSRGTSFGPYIWSGTKGLLNYHTWKIQIDESAIVSNYFLHALRQLTSFIEGSAHGASALVHVQKWQMEGFDFPMPPTKTEQEAIADALSDAGALIESLEQLLAKKRQIKQGAMQELLTGKKRLPGFETKGGYKQTDVGVIPVDWSSSTIDNLAIKVGSGVTPKGGNSNYRKAGRPFVRSQNVGWGILLLSDLVYIDNETHASFAATELHEGDVLLNITGASIGRSAIVDRRLAGGNVNQHVCIIRTDANRVTAQLINHLLLSRLGQKQIDSFQAGGNREGLNFGQIRSIEVPLAPTKTEQETISVALSDIDTEIAAIETKLAKGRQLRQGMMQELLTGRIRLI